MIIEGVAGSTKAQRSQSILNAPGIDTTEEKRDQSMEPTPQAYS
jgi:hypothetical protein